MSAPTLYLIDGSAYIYRAFYAIRNMSNDEGFPTNAVYGFTQMIRTLLEQEDPEYVGITFDDFENRERTFRNDLYAEYKANRPPMPEDLQAQLPYFRKVTEALNIPMLVHGGVEADDIIATLAVKAEAAGINVCIVSADKDLLQLLEHDNIRMIDTMRERVFTREDAEKRFGVPPGKIRYVMALSGDSSDNVPGVPGIGEKIGGRLIAEYGDLENLLAHTDEVSGKKRRENLVEFADQARLSLALVTLKEDVDVDLDLDALKLEAPNLVELETLFGELGFRAPLRQIRAWAKKRGWLEGPGAPAMPSKRRRAQRDKQYTMVLDEEALDHAIEACAAAQRFALDLETTSLNPLDAEIVGVALSPEPDIAFYVPVGHRYIGVPKQLDQALVLERLRPLIEAESKRKILQHAKYEWIVLQRHGITLRGIEWDTMLMSYLLDPERTSHGLDAIALDYLRHETIKYRDVAGTGSKRVNFEAVDVERATNYAAEDADITLAAYEVMLPAVVDANLRGVHDELELPLSIVLARMEQTGIRLDVDLLRGLGREFERKLFELQTAIDEIAGTQLNPNSPQQLREVLFERLGLPIKKHTQTGASTDSSVLTQLAELHPLPALILEARSYAKLRGTYIDALPQLVRADTGRVHTDFNQAVAATGRLSSSNPNLQNIPIRTDHGRRIRQAFVPEPGWTLIAADYSQIELRIMAHMAADPLLIEAFANGEDVHRVTASQIFDVPLASVADSQRRVGKTINFGVMYGMGATRLARDLGIRRPEAQTYIDQYFERYEAVKTFFDTLVDDARERGYSETMFGRRRLIKNIDGYGAQRSFSERVAVNMPIQGTAADIIKIAMVRLQARIDADELPLRMLLQVHDELVFEGEPGALDELLTVIRELMEGVVELKAPLVVDIGVGGNWLEAK